MHTLTRNVALTAMVALLGLPASVNAQDEQDLDPQQCTAEISPMELEAGSNAVPLTVTLSEDVGDVTGVESSDSGISVASPQDLARVDMAAEEEQSEPITMSDEQENTWTIWLNTTMAEAGTYEVTFVGSEGDCSAEVTVR